MRRAHGWSATLAERGLLAAPVVLRPMRICDARAYRQVRAANKSWLRPCDASSPEGPLGPSAAQRLASMIRRTPLESYVAVMSSRLQATLRIAACWAIWYDGQFAGQVSVFRIAWGPLRSADIGYWVDERLAGRGIMPTALAMVIDHCFQDMHLHRVEAGIQPQNVASRRAVEKLGLRDEGLRERQVHVDGAWRDHICYAITAEEVPGGLLSRWRSSVTSQK